MKPAITHSFPVFTALLLVVVLLFSCRKEQAIPCIPVEKPLSLRFPNDTITNLVVLPFESNRIWVQARSRLFELDIYTGEETPLGQAYRNFFNVEATYSAIDPYDSLMWTGGPNRHVVYYDSRTKKVEELPVNHVHKIIVEPDRVHLIAFHQVCFWDRRTKTLHQVPNLPIPYIQTCEIVDDSTVILDRAYTYYLHSRRLVKGYFSGGHQFKGYLRTRDGTALFYNNDSLLQVRNGKLLPLPRPLEYYNYNFVLANGKFWRWDDRFYYAFDPGNKNAEKFAYRLPPVNNYLTSVEFDARHIWIQRPGQLMLIDTDSHQQLEFRVSPEAKYQKTVLSDCNVYSVFENGIVISSKETFIHTCVPFDVGTYESQLVQMNQFLDSIGLGKDTTTAVALKKLIFVQKKYAGMHHVEVQQKLAGLDWQAFQNVPVRSPEEHEICYRNASLPFTYRKGCLINLLNQYGRNSKFQEVLYLEKEYLKYFGQPDRRIDYVFITHVDSVRSYLNRVARLEKSGLTADSLSYFKALALGTICSTDWYCSEGCGGCDFTLVTDRLKSFVQKFPESQLVDNALFDLLQYSFGYDSDDDSINLMNRELRAFLLKHPNSDLQAEIWYLIFQNCQYMYMPDKKGMKEAGKKFLQDFGADKRAPEVREALEVL